MTPANSLLRVTAEENQALIFPPGSHWSMTHPRCREELQHLHFECREQRERMLRLFLFSIFCCDKKFDCDKNILYLAKCLNCLEKFWLPHWSINHLRRVSVSKIMTSPAQGPSSLSSDWSVLAESGCSLAKLSCFSLRLRLRSQKVVTKLCKIPNDLTQRLGFIELKSTHNEA